MYTFKSFKLDYIGFNPTENVFHLCGKTKQADLWDDLFKNSYQTGKIMWF